MTNRSLYNVKRVCKDKSLIGQSSFVLFIIFTVKSRSSRPEVFCKKDILTNFAKFTGKHLCQRLFFNKVAGLRPANLLNNRLWYRCFLVNFVKFQVPGSVLLVNHDIFTVNSMYSTRILVTTASYPSMLSCYYSG